MWQINSVELITPDLFDAAQPCAEVTGLCPERKLRDELIRLAPFAFR